MSHSRRRFLANALIISSTLAACGGGTSGTPAAPSTDVSGAWSQAGAVPGASFAFTLVQQGTQVSGTGRFSIEAGPNGTVAITGSAEAGAVTLTFQYSNGWTASFEGSVSAPGVMRGTLATSFANGSGTVEFDRVAGSAG